MSISRIKKFEYLRDYGARDSKWDRRKFRADLVSKIFNRYDDLITQRWAKRIEICAERLDFNLLSDVEGGRLKLAGARFCHVKSCPVCRWRRSLMRRSQVYQRLPEVLESWPGTRFLFVTFTVKNCEVTDLRETIKSMCKAWDRLRRYSFIDKNVLGYIRTLEVTRNHETNQAHPHFHVIFHMRASYFSRGYMKHSGWIKAWRECLKVDYDPSVNVKAVRSGHESFAVAEVIKYCVKDSDMISDHSSIEFQNWYSELAVQLHYLREISSSGSLKNILRKNKKETDEDLIKAGENEPENPELKTARLTFDWHTKIKKYRRQK